MIITIVIDTFGINNNGTTISAMRFTEVLLQHGHKVRVVACADPKKNVLDSEPGFELFCVPELKIPIASWFAHKQYTLFAKPVLSTLRKAISGADVVHIYQPWSLGRAAQRIAKQLKVPAIAAFHIQPENISYNIGLNWFPPIERIIYSYLNLSFYRKFTHIQCPSKFIAAQLRNNGYKAWLHVISNGVHPEFHPRENQKKKPDGMFKLLMIGRLSPEKRQDVLIRAVQKSKYADRIQLYFAGCGPWERKLQRMGNWLPHPPIFGFYNRQKLIELICSCDLYVHSSDVEIEGISCLEAFACGKVPIISDSKLSATNRFALSQENLFKAGKPESLACRIDYWLSDAYQLEYAGQIYAKYGLEYSLERSVRQMERLYASLAINKKNIYYQGFLYKSFSRFFFLFIAIPIFQFWCRLILGARIIGKKNLRHLKGAVTLCNHVHLMDGALVALALTPRKIVYTVIPANLNSIWPGQMVRLLGGVAVPENIQELKVFFDEMELLLMKGHIVHFYPEGDLQPYDTNLRSFKKGAFHLAANSHVPLVPMIISFRKSKGVRRLIQKNPLMTLHIGKPIYPIAIDSSNDLQIRIELAQCQMRSFLSQEAIS